MQEFADPLPVVVLENDHCDRISRDSSIFDAFHTMKTDATTDAEVDALDTCNTDAEVDALDAYNTDAEVDAFDACNTDAEVDAEVDALDAYNTDAEVDAFETVATIDN